MGGTQVRVGRFLNSVNGNTNRCWLKGVAPRHILSSKPNEANISLRNNIQPKGLAENDPYAEKPKTAIKTE